MCRKSDSSNTERFSYITAGYPSYSVVTVENRQQLNKNGNQNGFYLN